jgi:hypothetical protein
MLPLLLPLLIALQVDPTPEPEDVKAGWGAFGIFLALIAAVAFLGFSLVKQLRKAQAAKDAGVYGDEPAGGKAGDELGDQADNDEASQG